MRSLSLALLLCCLSFSTINAATIVVDLQFDDPAWSGFVTYDDTTGVPFTPQPLVTIYPVIQLSITDGFAAWDETEMNDPFSDHGPGVLVDAFGSQAILLSATDTDTGAGLGSSVPLPGGLIESPTLQGSLGQTVTYTASTVPPDDADGDGMPDAIDNCPNTPNPDQADADLDLLGDACDPFPDDPDNEQAQCEADLMECRAGSSLDQDGDGEADATDACPYTPPGVGVDQAGCSLEQFCAAIDATTAQGARTCEKSDWRNDEPLMRPREADCIVDRGERGKANDRCVPR